MKALSNSSGICIVRSRKSHALWDKISNVDFYIDVKKGSTHNVTYMYIKRNWQGRLFSLDRFRLIESQ